MPRQKMAKAFQLVLLSIAIGLSFSSNVQSQVVTSVYEIFQNPGQHINENVQIEGLVFQYVPGTSNTVAYYLIRDDNGAEIQVNTVAGEPETNIKYRVVGVLYNENRRLFISELSRESLAVPTEVPVYVEADNSLLYYILYGMGFLLLISLIVLYSSRNDKKPSKELRTSIHSKSGEINNDRVVSMPDSRSDANDIFFNASGENTIKIDRDYMTMKALPGKLVVLNGEQAGNTLSLFGAPTEEGQVITIGRDSPDWRMHLRPGRDNAHIRIEDSTKTLSRLQAELIYSNGMMKLRNMGQANPTVVDDVILNVGETVNLNDGVIIQAGNLKMRYEM